MATPNPDSYSAASGRAIYAGMAAPSILISGDIVVAGDSLTDLAYSSGLYRASLPLARNPYRLIYNAGITNNTLDDLWARWSTDVLAKNPAIVFLRIGTNSLTSNVSAFMASYRRFTDSLLANGIWGVICAIPPKVGSSDPKPLNTALAALCAGTSGSRLRFLDDCVDLGDASYNYDPSKFIDGIHPNTVGQYVVGVSAAPILAGWFAPNDPRVTSAFDTYYITPSSDQYVKNPMMAGTSGGMYQCTGVVPTDWGGSCNGSGTAGVCSIIAADGGDPVQIPWARMNISTIGAGNHAAKFTASLGHPAIAANLLTIKRLDIICEVRLNLDTTALDKLTFGVSSGGTYVGRQESMGLGGNGVISKTMLLRCSYARDQGAATVAAYAANTLGFDVTILSAAAAASSIGTMDVRLASVRGQGT